jgi:proteasome lid subunit RPN8/RPN11
MAKKETEKEEKKASKVEEKSKKKAPKTEEKAEKKTTKDPKKSGKKSSKDSKSEAPKKKKKKKEAVELPDNALPQNFVAVGERVEEDKNIYISQSVYKKIHKFTKNKLSDEAGGILVGHVIEELGKTNILITGFIEAKHAEGTPTTLKFTHETWEYVHAEVEKKHPGKKILGWIHTHPDFGIFLSDYDKFIHENFFSDENQIAYVVDPIQKIEGLYFWINGKLTKCTGFYIYDTTGESIELAKNEEPEEDEEPKGKLFSFKNVLIAVLTAAVILLTFSHASVSKEIKALKTAQETLVASANNALASMSGAIEQLTTYVAELEAKINEAHPEPTETVDPSAPTDATGEPTGTTTQ